MPHEWSAMNHCVDVHRCTYMYVHECMLVSAEHTHLYDTSVIEASDLDTHGKGIGVLEVLQVNIGRAQVSVDHIQRRNIYHTLCKLKRNCNLVVVCQVWFTFLANRSDCFVQIAAHVLFN